MYVRASERRQQSCSVAMRKNVTVCALHHKENTDYEPIPP
jgi:hypothetical protein